MNIQITRNDLIEILTKEPKLDYGGMNWKQNHSPEHRADKWGDLKEIECCVEWLSNLMPANQIKKFNMDHSSYGYKHILEREFERYISNGSFIAAVVYLGIPYKTNNTPNVAIPISKNAMKKVYERDDWNQANKKRYSGR